MKFALKIDEGGRKMEDRGRKGKNNREKKLNVGRGGDWF